MRIAVFAEISSSTSKCKGVHAFGHVDGLFSAISNTGDTELQLVK